MWWKQKYTEWIQRKSKTSGNTTLVISKDHLGPKQNEKCNTMPRQHQQTSAQQRGRMECIQLRETKSRQQSGKRQRRRQQQRNLTVMCITRHDRKPFAFGTYMRRNRGSRGGCWAPYTGCTLWKATRDRLGQRHLHRFVCLFAFYSIENKYMLLWERKDKKANFKDWKWK